MRDNVTIFLNHVVKDYICGDIQKLLDLGLASNKNPFHELASGGNEARIDSICDLSAGISSRTVL